MKSAPERMAQLILERYPIDEVADAVAADVEENKTADRILSGELSLPTAQDAQHWHDRKQGKIYATPKEAQQANQIDQLAARLAAIEHELAIPESPNGERAGALANEPVQSPQ